MSRDSDFYLQNPTPIILANNSDVLVSLKLFSIRILLPLDVILFLFFSFFRFSLCSRFKYVTLRGFFILLTQTLS